MKLYAPALPPGTLLPREAHDPLVHGTQDLFWYHIEPHFKPITIEDVQELEPTPVDTPVIPHRGTRTPSDAERASPTDEVLGRVQCYPLVQRLTAAFLDEGRGQANAAKNVRSGIAVEDTWIGGNPQAMKEFSEVLEDRIRVELQERGLLDPEASDEILTDIRLAHWHLRNVNAATSALKSSLLKKIGPELSQQASRREKKISDDRVEIKYLESMMEKGGKRGKGRFAKLLNQMHPNRKLLPGEPLNVTNKPGSSAIEDKTISKKRKKKQTPNERSALKNQTDQNGVAGADPSDNLAPQIADIIWKHNNQAPIDAIVKEFVERVPTLAGDIKEARRRITSCMSFSRKPYRFRKLSDGVTYSATRV